MEGSIQKYWQILSVGACLAALAHSVLFCPSADSSLFQKHEEPVIDFLKSENYSGICAILCS